jgi:hypothetical protein
MVRAGATKTIIEEQHEHQNHIKKFYASALFEAPTPTKYPSYLGSSPQ